MNGIKEVVSMRNSIQAASLKVAIVQVRAAAAAAPLCARVTLMTMILPHHQGITRPFTWLCAEVGGLI